jgi:energy-coupling factor transporter ATP-binding protein EcfA2
MEGAQKVNIDDTTLSCMSHVNLTVHQMLEKSEEINDKVQVNEKLRNAALNQPEDLANKPFKPIIIVGPSGVGKSTLINVLTAKYPNSFGFSVSFTTRAPRAGEKDGVNYNFVTHDTFNEMITAEDFIEYCHVHSNMYGTAKSQIRSIQDNKKIPLLDIDI